MAYAVRRLWAVPPIRCLFQNPDIQRRGAGDGNERIPCYLQSVRVEKRNATTDRSVRTYLKELEAADLLEIKQRGLGKTNLYRLHLTVKPKNGNQGRRP